MHLVLSDTVKEHLLNVLMQDRNVMYTLKELNTSSDWSLRGNPYFMMTTQRKAQIGARIQITDIMDFLVSNL